MIGAGNSRLKGASRSLLFIAQLGTLCNAMPMLRTNQPLPINKEELSRKYVMIDLHPYLDDTPLIFSAFTL
jgi:hypothetical protein